MLFQQNHVVPAHLRQVVGGRATDDAATDDNNPRLLRKINRCLHVIRVPIRVYAAMPRR